MPTASREKIKLYIVLGLSLLFVIVAYFRFFHGKADLPVGAPGATGVPTAVQAPAIDTKALPIPPAMEKGAAVSGLPRTALRDIFEPRKQSPSEAQRPGTSVDLAVPPEPPKPLPSLKLTGTIVGGKNPLAFINGRTLRLGERIEGFEVISITQEQVTLKDDGRKMLLNVLEGMKKEPGI